MFLGRILKQKIHEMTAPNPGSQAQSSASPVTVKASRQAPILGSNSSPPKSAPNVYVFNAPKIPPSFEEFIGISTDADKFLLLVSQCKHRLSPKYLMQAQDHVSLYLSGNSSAFVKGQAKCDIDTNLCMVETFETLAQQQPAIQPSFSPSAREVDSMIQERERLIREYKSIGN